MKKYIPVALAVLACVLFNASCAGPKAGYHKYQGDFYGVFDTYTVVTGYAESEDAFNSCKDIIYNEMLRLHRLFDIYNDYEGLNNIKTINDSAGKEPVEVEADIIELLELCRIADDESGGAVNAGMGAVLRIWHEYRDKAGTGNAELPPPDMLEQARWHTDINNMIIDKKQSTVFLNDPGMALDVGALAKGFAVQKAMELAREAGFVSGIISAGGNVCIAGKPMDGRESWEVGLQNPFSDSGGEDPLIDIVRSDGDVSLVTSGEYQRFYVAEGKRYNHIIDPATLMPAERFAAVSVIHPDSGIADMLSTSIFILPYEQGLELIRKYNAEAIWISHESAFNATGGYKDVSQRLFRQ